MKSFWVVLVALALSGCFSQKSDHRVEVAGSPDDVSRFVAAERSLDPDAVVTHSAGQGRAVFSTSSEEAVDEIADRATAARLNVTLTSLRWSIQSGT
ncbi:hypothetical protein [Brevundimonas variabilis]|uniref:Organic hydroperoxide reductase OsmC/OhrA n=1 Tax=Brevundimonas variabilis TaxID=74312 RepID=A0A7W9FEQ0_9CAUL|nr:hypothetical protein [Brevundimonas variabilis]MBB5746515.1 organic hydroperoxide reductase OsmC/OhrA [Brevundimonas variabilis]